MHYVYESSRKDRNTRMNVCAFMHLHGCYLLIIQPRMYYRQVNSIINNGLINSNNGLPLRVPFIC